MNKALLFGVLLTLAFIPFSSATFADTSYAYRSPLIVVNNNTVNNMSVGYTVMAQVNLTGLMQQGKIQENATDYRVFFNTTELDRHIPVSYGIRFSNRSGDNVNLGNFLNTLTSGTLEFWFYQPTEITSKREFIFQKGDGLSIGDVSMYLQEVGGVDQIFFSHQELLLDLTLSGSVSENNWTHVAVAWNTTGFFMWINGTMVSQNSTIITGITDDGNGLILGSQSTGLLPSRATIDEFRSSSIVRYTANFTPSTLPFNNESTSIVIFHFDNSFNNSASGDYGYTINSSPHFAEGYIIGNWNSLNNVFFKTRQIILLQSNDSTNYFAYYGNSSKINPPVNLSNVYQLYDDFELQSLGALNAQHGWFGPTGSYNVTNSVKCFNGNQCLQGIDVGDAEISHSLNQSKNVKFTIHVTKDTAAANGGVPRIQLKENNTAIVTLFNVQGSQIGYTDSTGFVPVRPFVQGKFYEYILAFDESNKFNITIIDTANNTVLAQNNSRTTQAAMSEGINNVTLIFGDQAGTSNEEFWDLIHYELFLGGVRSVNGGEENQSVADITPPIITISSPTNTTYTTTSVALNVSANEVISVWKYSLDGAANITFTPNIVLTSLSEGSHTVKVFANDTSNNFGAANVSFSVDTVAPMINLVSPTNTTYTTTSVNISVSATQPTSSFWYVLDGGLVVLFSPNITLSGLSQGQHALIVFVNDTVGNAANSSVTFSVDSIAPTVTIISPSNTTYNVSSITLNVSVSESATLTRSLNGGANQSFTSPTSITASEGSNTLKVFAIDGAGNVGANMVVFTFTSPPSTPTPTPTGIPFVYKVMLSVILIAVGLFVMRNFMDQGMRNTMKMFLTAIFVIISITILWAV